MRIKATLRDEFRAKRRRELDPLAAAKAQVRSPVHSPSVSEQVPIARLVTDPVLAQARAEEQFHSYQVATGSELLKTGFIETAADEQNVRVASENLDKPYFDHLSPQIANPLAKADLQFGRGDVWNNPFSTVPGGMPFKGPG